MYSNTMVTGLFSALFEYFKRKYFSDWFILPHYYEYSKSHSIADIFYELDTQNLYAYSNIANDSIEQDENIKYLMSLPRIGRLYIG